MSAKLVPTFADRGFYVVSETDTQERLLGFLDRNCYFFFQVAPQLTASVVYWSEFLDTDPEARVRFSELPDFLRSNGLERGPLKPREYK
jgi:hypothetical protein